MNGSQKAMNEHAKQYDSIPTLDKRWKMKMHIRHRPLVDSVPEAGSNDMQTL